METPEEYVTVKTPEWHYWKAVAKELKASNDRYRQALEWYADSNNYLFNDNTL